MRSFILLRLFWLWASQVKLVVRKSPANAEDTREAGSIPESGRSPGGGHGNPLQYSCQENPGDRGVGQSQRVGHNWSNLGRTHRGMHMLVRVTSHLMFPNQVYRITNVPGWMRVLTALRVAILHKVYSCPTSICYTFWFENQKWR